MDIMQNNLNLHLAQYEIGQLISFFPLLGGTVNSNYLIITTQGKWVFTILENMTLSLAEQISLFLLFLNHHHFPCPKIQLTTNEAVITHFNKKPSLLVSFLEGKSPLYPTPKQCHQIGSALARLHLLTQSYLTPIKNTMNDEWRIHTANMLMPGFSTEDQNLIKKILEEQKRMPYDQLPHGIIHFDLFRDNTIFMGEKEDKLNGIIDFYYACYGALVFDLSICINDWCTNWQKKEGTLIEENLKALMRGYESLRPLNDIENQSLAGMLRIAALHFWLTRTQSQDEDSKTTGSNKLLKDPQEYKLILINRL